MAKIIVKIAPIKFNHKNPTISKRKIEIIIASEIQAAINIALPFICFI